MNSIKDIDLDYETLFSIYHQRKNHKLDEWREFTNILRDLPCIKPIMEGNTND